ncbi:hypothetical protein L5515_014649 [Caenorhabditis briggsae]|uniref:Uncharacterized protein n=1 Tax=Caenorhabditis briggsae TaxID=6238 RepID=A0AAE9J8Y8_CAEBR|nr:hypothetical protein L5515_014649 [Caenorhabditis briggsae]
MFAKLHQLINTTVIPVKSEKDEVAAIIGGWDNCDILDLNLLKFHENTLDSLTYSEDGGVAHSKVRGAADALAAIPTLLKAITDGITKLDGRHRVMEIFGDFAFLVLSLKNYKEKSPLRDDDVANLSKLFSKSQSYRTGNRVAMMLKELAHASMEPVLLSIWKDLRTDVTTKAFKEGSDSVLRVLNLITSAGYSSEGKFKTSWTHLNQILKPEISIFDDVTHFLDIFKNLTGAFDEYTQVLTMVKNLTESKGYKTAINGVETVKNLEKAVVINTVTPTPPKQGYSTYKVDRTTFGNAITRVVQKINGPNSAFTNVPCIQIR